MQGARNGSTVYVYTMANDGRVIERQGIISLKEKGKEFMLVTFKGGQRICLPQKAEKIHNNSMWSNVQKKNVYIEKMIEVLLERREAYQNKLEANTRRITAIKSCVC